MSVVESQLHFLQVEHKVSPADADLAPQFGLGNAAERLYPVNVAEVIVGELCAYEIWPWR